MLCALSGSGSGVVQDQVISREALLSIQLSPETVAVLSQTMQFFSVPATLPPPLLAELPVSVQLLITELRLA